MAVVVLMSMPAPENCQTLEHAANVAVSHGGTHLREVNADRLPAFNAREPVTNWSHLWLMDLPKGGVIFAGHEDEVCMVGVQTPEAWDKAINDLEGRGT